MTTKIRQFHLLGPANLPTPLSLKSGQAILLLALMLATTNVSAMSNTSDLSDSELAWRYHCTTCHGRSGIANSDRYPNLLGQNVLYLEARLKSFRAREEPRNPMNAQAIGLTDEEISRLANYFHKGGRGSEQ